MTISQWLARHAGHGLHIEKREGVDVWMECPCGERALLRPHTPAEPPAIFGELFDQDEPPTAGVKIVWGAE
jgi:hypothetical protein